MPEDEEKHNQDFDCEDSNVEGKALVDSVTGSQGGVQAEELIGDRRIAERLTKLKKENEGN